VASLEITLGVKLYIRRKAPIQLTAEGTTVVRAARSIEKEVEKMREELSSELHTQRRHVGLIDSIAHLLYSSPNERSLLNGTEIMVDNSKRILRDLTSGKIELGVITGQSVSLGPEITVQKLHDEEFVFVASPQLAAEKSKNEIDDWLAINPDSTSYHHFTKLFTQRGMRVRPIFYSTSMELLRDMAMAGKGTALLPRHIVRDALSSGALSVIDTKPMYRPIWAVTRARNDKKETLPLTSQISTLLAGSAR